MNVMTRMRQFGIVCKPTKTEIARPCNELLGYIVGREGLRANPKKIDKLMDIDLPRSKEGLNFFIGRSSRILSPIHTTVVGPGSPLAEALKRSKATQHGEGF
jgi:hypothetical protein